MVLSALPVSSPSEAGVDARSVLAFLDALDASTETDPHGLMVLRHGRVVAAGWWAPYSADRWQLLYSLSKSFTSTALGLAVAEGRVDLDRTVLSYFPEWDTEVTDAGSRAITVRNAVSMATGHRADTWVPALAADPDPVRGFLSLPPEAAPGSVFAYNQPATHSVAAIIQRVTGQSLTGYLRPRLFDPLGVPPVLWHQWPPGRDIGFTGLHATTETIAKLGQLYLQQGRWQDRQLLSPDWVAEATRRQIGTDDEPEIDWRQGYGFQFWMSQHGYRGDGAYGQFCLVLPEQDAVIAITSATTRMQSVLDDVWTHLLPGLGGGVGSKAADDELADRLAGLALPPVAGRAVEAGQPRSYRPHGGRCADLPSLTGVTLQPGEHATLTLQQDGGLNLTAGIGTGGWEVSDGPIPVAVSGGRSAGATLHCDLLFLDTPHRLTVRLDDADNTFTATWVTAPLGVSRLEQLEAVAVARGR